MSSTNNNTAAAEDRLPLYQKRKPHANTVPPLRKSLSRNTMLYNNNPNNPSPTRPLFHGNKIDQQQRQLTAEAAVFPEHPTPLFHPPQQPQDYHTITKRSSSTPLSIQGDARSVISASESTRSMSTKRKKRASMASSFANPTDIFAQNLSDAVMDAEDSDGVEYRDKPNPSYTMPPWTYNNNSDNFDNLNAIPSYYDRHYSSTGTESNTDGCGDNYIIQEKYFPSRRPVLRPSVSEIRPTSSTSSFKKKLRPAYKYHPSNYYGNQPSDEEYAPLVRSRPPRRRKGTASHHGSHNSKKQTAGRKTCCTFLCVIFGCFLALCFVWALIVIYASPLVDVEVVGISNVLGTQKELIFNLQVRARNSNWWTIRMTNTAFSVFASSHYVPTALMSVDNNTLSTNEATVDNITSTFGADPAEFLGTIYHLEDPLIYQSGGLFTPVVSTATSQIQIKNPGSTKDDNSGNERWSLLIRYPYELTVRGVLKYQILPYLPSLAQLHSVRVCKMSRIDPATGKISDDVPIPEKSICDDPSPVEGSDIIY